MGGCATKENKENKPAVAADESDGCVSEAGFHLPCANYPLVYMTY